MISIAIIQPQPLDFYHGLTMLQAISHNRTAKAVHARIAPTRSKSPPNTHALDDGHAKVAQIVLLVATPRTLAWHCPEATVRLERAKRLLVGEIGTGQEVHVWSAGNVEF